MSDEKITISVADRFWKKVVKTDACWLWIGCKRDGYGQIRVHGKMVNSHRWAYEYFVGVIPSGLQIDHLCRTRHCVNPEHLEPVTQRENIRRGNTGLYLRMRTHCPKNHAYDAANTGIGKRQRNCRACSRDRQRTRRSAIKNMAAVGVR